MSPHRISVAPQIVDEASHWFVLMREPSVSTEEREAFAQWLRTSPVHVGAYLEIARLWADAAHVDRDLPVHLAADESPNVFQLRDESPRPSAAPSPPPFHTEGQAVRKSRRFVLAASVLLACVAAGSAWWYVNRTPEYITEIGEQRVITLDDGSTVRLDSRSKFTVHLSPKFREVDLADGQALFEVAHDAARPFIVKSGDVAIRAVGTQFDVNRRRSGTVVTVVEGRVRVGAVPPSGLSQLFSTATTSQRIHEDPPPGNALSAGGGARDVGNTPGAPAPGTANSRIVAGEEGAVFLSAGQQVKIAGTGAIERPTQANTAAATSWLQQELIFDGQSLNDVLEEFNRYTRIPIILGDPSLGDLRINAVFHTTNPDSLLRFVSRFDGVQVEKSAKEIRISKK